MRRYLLPLALLLAVSCAKKKSTAAPPAATSTVTFAVNADAGTFNVSQSGQLVFENATMDVLLSTDGGQVLGSCSDEVPRSATQSSGLTCTTHGIELSLTLTAPPGDRYFTAQVTATNTTSAPVTVLKLTPLSVDADHGGALWLGETPAHHRVLENGELGVLDDSSQLVNPADPPIAIAQLLPIPYRGNSVSNWNHVVVDNDSSAALVAGYLSFEHSVPTLGIAPPVHTGATNGRTPFSYWAETAIVFNGKQLMPGDSVSSELLYVEPYPADPVAALESYASVLATAQNISTWAQRGNAVPVNWCSWTGGSGTGGYGQGINGDLIQQNLSVWVNELLQPFGADTFEIDDGWEPDYGDWTFNAQDFPDGGTAEAATIAAAGENPGLWLAPFSVDPNSTTAQQHPDWLQPVVASIVGTYGKNKQTLDLTNPAVLTYVQNLFQTEVSQGWTWSKVDFTYFDLLGQPQYAPLTPNIEAWRGGWEVIRNALGPNVFLLGVGVMGANIGRLDSMRLTGDNGPQWDEVNPDNVLENDRAFKATVRTGSRRWFYQNRVWVNHDDMIYFRSSPDTTIPPLTLDESKAFATWIGLGGGVVELGDELVQMEQNPAWIDVARRIMPVWPDGARPLDVLNRDYPEQFQQQISSPAGDWTNMGLFNWGTNRDWTQIPPVQLGETARTFHVTCDGDCLAWEFWSETFLGRFTGGFDVTVPPHTAQVVSVRAPTGAPQLLGSNRHVTQGAVELGSLTWNAAEKTLYGSVLGASGTTNAPFQFHLAFYVPTGFTLNNATVGGSMDAKAVQTGEVVDLTFTLPLAAAGGMVPIAVTFD